MRPKIAGVCSSCVGGIHQVCVRYEPDPRRCECGNRSHRQAPEPQTHGSYETGTDRKQAVAVALAQRQPETGSGRRRWTGDEVEQLRQLVGEGWSVSRSARKLGRSEQAVEEKKSALRLRRGSRDAIRDLAGFQRTPGRGDI